MSNGKKTIGNIKVNIGIAYHRILDIKIVTKEGTHGRMHLQLEADESMQKNNLQPLIGQKVEATLDDGTRIFTGICTGAGLSNTASYKSVTIEAASKSIEMDKEPEDKIFQDPSKTLGQIAKQIGSGYGAELTLDKDVAISHIVSQKKETDWEFLKRIAAAEGKVIYTDILEDGIRIFIGKTGLRKYDETTLRKNETVRDVAQMARMEANEGCGEGYMVDLMHGETEELTMSAGDRAGDYIVRAGEILVEKGMLVNRVSYGYPPSIRPSVEEKTEPGMANSVLQGTVTAVSGNQVQVQFDADSNMGAPTWIPYESAISNSFYSMPDEGDRVFVYYENNGKMACLGSRHKNTGHPDMQKPEEKVLTNRDKMIKYTQTGIKLSATRKLTDEEAADAVSIVMDEETGITINSGREILLASQKQIRLGVGDVSEATQKATAGREKVNQRIAEGKQAFARQGGYLSLIGEQFIGQEMDKLKASLDSHFIHFFIPEKEEEKTLSDAQTYESGVLTLYGYRYLTLAVGESNIRLDSDIHINAEQFQWLGYERKEHEKQEQPLQDWWETALDGLQFALDIAGMLPAPVGTVCDVVNAGVSLARGDLTGAALSLVSSIPVVGDSLGAAKIAGKAAKTVIKSADTLKSLEKMIAVAKGLYMMAQSAYSIYLTKDGWEEIIQKMKNGENPLEDPGCVSTMIQTASGGVMFTRGFCDTTGLTPKIQNKVKGATQKFKKAVADKVKSRNKKGCGDPINVVTGSLMMDYEEMTLHDTREDFVLHRIHESIHTNEGMMLGSRWYLNIETRLIREEDTITVQKPDMHVETFHLEEGNWKNERNGDLSLTLKECRDGYILEEAQTQKQYHYQSDGKIAAIEDACKNRTVFCYEGEVLTRMTLASGQYLDFTFENKKLKKVEDILGRKITYAYEGELLSEVTMPNGGKIRYTYTNAGYIHTVTDQNGKTYMTCEYDRKGRVVRQALATGEEYILSYDEAKHQNRFTNLKNGQHIIYEYGRQRIPLKEIHRDGSYSEKRYDQWENCIYERDFNGNETHRAYDIHGMLQKEITPDGTETIYTYDEKNRPVTKTDSSGAEEAWSYDEKGNPITYRQRLEGERYAITHYTYDSRGRIQTITNPNGNVTIYDYRNSFAGPALKTLPEGETEGYRYDKAGRLMEKWNHAGRIRYGYNSRDDLTSITDEQGNETHYRYDSLGNLLEERQPLQDAANMPGIRYRYDALDRRISQETPEGNHYLYQYGNEDCLTASIHPNAAAEGSDAGIRYDYDEKNRRIRTHYPDGGCERYFYDGNGNLIKKVPPTCYDSTTDDGEGYHYTYDSMNRLTTITNPLGEEEAAYRYDHAGRIIRYREGRENPESIYTYDHAGRLLSCRKPLERAEDGSIRYGLTTYAYDDMGNQIREKRYRDAQTKNSATGRVHTITYHYNRSNRLSMVEDSTGACKEYTYDEDGRLIREQEKTDENTFREQRYILDETGKVLKSCQKLEEEAVYPGTIGYAITEYTYDANGNVTGIRLPEGGTITYTYDYDNRVLSESHEEEKGDISRHLRYTYDHAGNLLTREDEEGRTYTYTYDLMNRETTRTNPDGGIHKRVYDQNGKLTGEVLPQENAEKGILARGYRYTYDATGRRLTTTAPDGTRIEENSYDAGGRAVRKRNGATYAYDLAGRQMKITTPEGNSQSFAYDALGNLIKTTDALGNTTTFQTDAWGRITQITKADNSRESYTYDYAGNLLTATDGENHTVTYAYNCRGLQKSRTDAAGKTEYLRYDREGNVVESTDRNGNVLQATYNMYHSLTSRRSKTGDINEAYGYYPDGRLQYAIGGGMRYEYHYDSMGRVTQKKASARTLLTYTYDLNGNQSSITDLTGKTTTYRYDAADRITEVADNGTIRARYRYHADGTLRQLEVGETLLTEYGYDKDKNILSQKTLLQPAEGSPVILTDNTYRYDGNANRIGKHTLSGETRYTYDCLNQVTKAETPQGTEQYTYDRAGNRLTRSTDSKKEEYRYDRTGKLITRTIIPHPEEPESIYHYDYDKQGNLLSDGENQYTYDAMNRLTQVTTSDGKTQINRYDGEGLRAELEENGRLVSFIFHKDKVVVETTDNNTIRYIRGYELISSDSEKAKTYYHYVTDELGSITHITDEDGEILNRYEYDVYGNFTHKEETIENRFGFTGEQYDPVTNLYYLRARFYSPAIGRFIQEDTYYGDGLNLYTYCHNNPVTYVDPSGNVCDKKTNTKKSGTETDLFLPDEYYQNLDDNIAKAIAARDAEVARIQGLSKTQQSNVATVVAGVDIRTGEVYVGVKNSRVYKGNATCAEDIVFRGLGGNTNANIIMTPAIRPRNNEVIPVCTRCQTKYPQNQFVKGTTFQ